MTKDQKNIIYKFTLLIIIILCIYFYENVINNQTTNSNNNIEMRNIDNTEPVDNTTNNDSNDFKIYFIDVGQADCILISNNKEYALVDAGNNEDGQKLVNYFHSLDIKEFKYVIGTHAHEDHIGGMDDIINNFSIEHFYMPDVVTTTRTFEDILDSLEAKEMAFETPEIGETFTLAETKFTVLHVGTDKSDLNDTSIVLKVNYKNTSYLLTGDATSNVEKQILDKDIESTVLKVGHHGSSYSSNAQFLKKVNPKYAIIQVGKNNSYDHPKKITLDKLERIGTKVYRTDQDGTIILSSDGKNIYIETVQTDTNG